MRPSRGSLERKKLKNEIRALIKSAKYAPGFFPSFILYRGKYYDLPDSQDLNVVVRGVLDQIPKGG